MERLDGLDPISDHATLPPMPVFMLKVTRKQAGGSQKFAAAYYVEADTEAEAKAFLQVERDPERDTITVTAQLPENDRQALRRKGGWIKRIAVV